MGETNYTPVSGYPQAPPSPTYGPMSVYPTAPPPKVPSSPGSGSVATHGPPSLQHVATPIPPHPQQQSFGSYPAVPPTAPPVVPPHATLNTTQEQQESYPMEKIVTGNVVAISSIVIIALVYVSFAQPGELEDQPVGPLAAGAVFLLLNISVGIWLCTDFTAPNGVVGLVPVGFGAIGCITFVIYYAYWVSFKNDGIFWGINRGALLNSASAFSGMALGNVIGYVFFGNAPRRAG